MMLVPPHDAVAKAEQKTSAVKILGISGSGRRDSYNTALLIAAQEFLSADVTLELYDVSRFPLFNEDLEKTMPPAVKEFKGKIRAADAIIFAEPEYNLSISAVMKNAVEWGNRPDGDNSWDGKPAAIVSASTGSKGGARAQLELRKIMVDLNMHPINQPQFLLANSREKFDPQLRLTDERARQLLQELISALLQWTFKLRGGFADVAPLSQQRP